MIRMLFISISDSNNHFSQSNESETRVKVKPDTKNDRREEIECSWMERRGRNCISEKNGQKGRKRMIE